MSGITMSRDPIEVLTKFADALQHPPKSAFLYAGGRQVSRILERTQKGLDVDGHSFTAYSGNGPYYWYPSKGLKDPRGARNRRLRQAGSGQKTDKGIKFASYGAAKAAITGDSTVNLSGMRGAPHILQAMTVKLSGDLLVIGIYGEEAKRASGHNEGTKHLPKRRFFDASDSDTAAMAQDLLDATMQMLKKKDGGK